MPTVEINKNDLNSLLTQKFSDEKLESLLESAKGELKNTAGENYKIELNDTNRPDLWTSAGIARQINLYLKNKQYTYPFFNTKDSDLTIEVDSNIKNIRPYVVGFAVKKINITEPLLLELIQNQEKFADNFGRKRKDIAIGIYKLKNITFPVKYKAVAPDAIKFIPLGMEQELNLKEILKEHPKGIEYKHLVEEYDKYPILLDSKNNVLSFPPVINSKFIGEVEVGDTEIFIELTGYNLYNLMIIANIFACDLADRGAEIIPAKISYPYHTVFGENFIAPKIIEKEFSLDKSYFSKIVGFMPEDSDIKENLEKMGFINIDITADTVKVEIPPYRNDIMHAVDVVEDFIIGKGFNNIKFEMPTYMTVGSLSNLELLSDKVRDIMVGIGFQEVISNILNSKENIYDKMNLPEINGVEIANPMTESYNVLRNSIIPVLLEVESFSGKADYPHKIFEVGDIALKDKENNYGSKTLMNMGAASIHSSSNFSEVKSYLNNIMYYIGIDNFELREEKIPFLIDGRSAAVFVNNIKTGYIGEVHPDVLEKWDINMPVTVLELTLDYLLK